MNSVQFLDAVRAKHGLSSDRKLAKLLAMPESRISLYRTGRRKLDPNACIAVAAALELPPEHVLAAVQAERAKRTEHRRIWERLANLAKTAHVLAVIGVVGASVVSPRPAAGVSLNAQEYTLCGDRRRRRRRRSALHVAADRRAFERRAA